MDNYAGTTIGADGRRYPVNDAPQFKGPVRPWAARIGTALEPPLAGPAPLPADDRAITSGVVAGSLPPEPVTPEPASFADQTGRSEELRAAQAEAEQADAERRAAEAAAEAQAIAEQAVADAEAAHAAGEAANQNLHGAQPGVVAPADDPEAESPTVEQLDELTHDQLVDVGEANGFVFHKSHKVDDLRDEIRVQLADINDLPKRDLVVLADLLEVEYPASATGSKILERIVQHQNQES